MANGLQASDVIASGAALVALFAMFATFWQVKIARDHNRLSVMPHLDASFLAFPNEPFRIKIFNNGLGPAVVRAFHISVDGTEFLGSGPSMPVELRAVFTASGLMLNLMTLGPGTPIRPDGEFDLISCPAAPQSLQQFEAEKAFGRRLGLRAVYESIYGQERELRISFADYG